MITAVRSFQGFRKLSQQHHYARSWVPAYLSLSFSLSHQQAVSPLMPLSHLRLAFFTSTTCEPLLLSAATSSSSSSSILSSSSSIAAAAYSSRRARVLAFRSSFTTYHRVLNTNARSSIAAPSERSHQPGDKTRPSLAGAQATVLSTRLHSPATKMQLQTAITQIRSHAGHSHGHGHGHGHGHSHDTTYLTSSNKSDPGVRITRIGLLVNLGMAVGKGAGGVVFHSQA